MEKQEIINSLMLCFPKGFINRCGEFVANKKGNAYFNLEKRDDLWEVYAAVLEWFSRDAYKTEPYYSDAANAKYHKYMLDGINRFLGEEFTPDDMELIYTYLGNGCNHSLTMEFIKQCFDLEVLREYARRRNP